MDYFVVERFKIFGCEFPEDGDQSKHVAARKSIICTFVGVEI